MYNIFTYPSIYAHILHALLMLAAVIVIWKYYPTFKKLDPYRLVILFLLLSLVMGVHSLSHLGLETNYNFRPSNF